MRKLTFPALAFLVISLIACGPGLKSKADEEIPSTWVSISEDEYSIHFPDTFIVDKTGQSRMQLILLSKQTSDKDRFRENINLIIQNLGGQTMDLDWLVNKNENQIRSMFPDGKILVSERHKEKEKEYHEVVFSGTQNKIHLKGLQHYFIKDNKAYILTFSSEEEQYDHYLDVCKKIMSTLEIK